MTHAVHSSLASWRVRASIYSQLLASGRAPTLAQLAHASEATQDEVREALAILAWNQQVVLQADGELLAAEPFSAVPTPFVVDIGAAWPAWGFGICCSLGIGAMAGRDARVTTHCGHCFRRLEIRVEDGRCSGADGAVAQFVVPADHAVDDVVHACSTDLLYCSAGHAAAWRERYRQPEGQLLSLGQTWRLAAVWYGTDRRDPCWRGWTAFEANEIFAALGLPAPFWRLTEPHRRLVPPVSKRQNVFRVFADETGAGGNPALVVDPADGLAEDALAMIARHFSGESTCVYRTSGVPRLRFFVPAGEIAVSAHGMLAAATVLSNGASDREVRFDVGDRQVRVEVRKDRGAFASLSAPREPVETVGDSARRLALSALGLGTDALHGWPVLTAGAERRTTILPLASPAALHPILTSKSRVRRACEALGSTGLCPFAVTGPREVQARHFPADSGVIEDAATAAAAIALGSATGSVYPLPSLRDAPIRIRQGSAMGEPSDLFLREDEAGKLDIGGRVARVSLAPEPAGSGTVFSA